jgi:hypothetical protein
MSSFENDPAQHLLPLVTPPQPGEKRAARWQITATAIGVVMVIALFLWGLNNQRDESAGQQTAGTQPTQVTPQGASSPPPAQNSQQAGQQQPGQSNAPTTTGQGGGEQGDAAQKTNAGQQSNQQPTNPGQNGPPTDNSGQPAQPRGHVLSDRPRL